MDSRGAGRELFIKRANEADEKAVNAGAEETARTWRMVASTWRTLADQADKLNSEHQRY